MFSSYVGTPEEIRMDLEYYKSTYFIQETNRRPWQWDLFIYFAASPWVGWGVDCSEARTQLSSVWPPWQCPALPRPTTTQHWLRPSHHITSEPGTSKPPQLQTSTFLNPQWLPVLEISVEWELTTGRILFWKFYIPWLLTACLACQNNATFKHKKEQNLFWWNC